MTVSEKLEFCVIDIVHSLHSPLTTPASFTTICKIFAHLHKQYNIFTVNYQNFTLIPQNPFSGIKSSTVTKCPLYSLSLFISTNYFTFTKRSEDMYAADLLIHFKTDNFD